MMTTLSPMNEVPLENHARISFSICCRPLEFSTQYNLIAVLYMS
jgi:hypothetical protein